MCVSAAGDIRSLPPQETVTLLRPHRDNGRKRPSLRVWGVRKEVRTLNLCLQTLPHRRPPPEEVKVKC